MHSGLRYYEATQFFKRGLFVQKLEETYYMPVTCLRENLIFYNMDELYVVCCYLE